MKPEDDLHRRIEAHAADLSRSELRVARHIAAHRADALVASAAEMAARIGTSDATVIRTAKALGYPGLDGLRRALADELHANPTPAGRVAGTLETVRGDLDKALRTTFDQHIDGLKTLRRQITPESFRRTVDKVLNAKRVAIFGIGPSSALATYFAIQGRRFGLDVTTLTDTGLLLADGLLGLRRGDLLMIMAYGRVYPELPALFDRADRLALPRILLTDTLGPKLAKRSDLVLTIPRGRADTFSMHSATLAFLETLLIGVATRRPAETLDSLAALNDLRSTTTGRRMDL